ncbi:hypothetical protein RIF29_25589 [Crotalaria pallida]|uniref:Uncharacterized protein n=1 Tax=Crotalaria pallida TaxID=3830 RepID=A0AAN9EMQ0_CROPI
MEDQLGGRREELLNKAGVEMIPIQESEDVAAAKLTDGMGPNNNVKQNEHREVRVKNQFGGKNPQAKVTKPNGAKPNLIKPNMERTLLQARGEKENLNEGVVTLNFMNNHRNLTDEHKLNPKPLDSINSNMDVCEVCEPVKKLGLVVSPTEVARSNADGTMEVVARVLLLMENRSNEERKRNDAFGASDGCTRLYFWCSRLGAGSGAPGRAMVCNWHAELARTRSGAAFRAGVVSGHAHSQFKHLH